MDTSAVLEKWRGWRDYENHGLELLRRTFVSKEGVFVSTDRKIAPIRGLPNSDEMYVTNCRTGK